MALKIKRGHGAPSELLKEGEPYLDLDNGDVYWGDGSRNIRLRKSLKNDFDIKIFPVSIPAIQPSTREVVTVNLGSLDNPKEAIVGFYQTNATEDEIKRYNFSKAIPVVDGDTGIFGREVLNRVIDFPIIHSKQFHIWVCEDYLSAMRSISGTDWEKDLSGNSINKYAFTYQDLGGLLIGTYNNSTGALVLNKKVIMESAWLSQSGSNTIFNMALFNGDTESNTAKDMQLVIYQ